MFLKPQQQQSPESTNHACLPTCDSCWSSFLAQVVTGLSSMACTYCPLPPSVACVEAAWSFVSCFNFSLSPPFRPRPLNNSASSGPGPARIGRQARGMQRNHWQGRSGGRDGVRQAEVALGVREGKGDYCHRGVSPGCRSVRRFARHAREDGGQGGCEKNGAFCRVPRVLLLEVEETPRRV